MLGDMWRAAASALGTADLRRVQVAWGISQVGAWGFMVALAVYAYRAGGASAVGAAAFVRMVPAGIAVLIAGLLVDRHARRNVIIWSLVIRAVLLACIAAGVAGSAPLPVILALAALVTVAGSAHRPAQSALLPVLADTPRQLAASNAIWSGLDSGGFLLGSLVGGAFIAAAGPDAAFAATAALCAAAAVAMLPIAPDRVPSHRRSDAGVSGARELLAGGRAVARERRLRLVVGFSALSTLVMGAADVLVVVMALELLGLGDAGVGWLNVAWGIGGLVGGATALVLLGRGRLARGLAAGGLLVGLSLMSIGGAVSVPDTFALLTLLGLGYALIEVATFSLVQRLSSDELIGRACAITESAYWLTNGIGAILTPVVVALLGARGAMVAVGAVLPAAVAARWAALVRLEAGAAVPEAQFKALRAVPAFAPLPIATVENLSFRLVPVHARAGDVVIREGERGDRFYIVADGRADVSRRGRHVATPGPGDFFGEIALLRDVARTATVSAGTDLLLYTLDRGDFLLAIGAHPKSHAAVERVADARLMTANLGE